MHTRTTIMVVIAVLASAAVVQAAAIARFDMDALEADGKTFLDVTGNGHDATYNRTVATSAEDPFNKTASSSVSQTVGGGAGTVAGLADPGTMNLNADGSVNMTMECWYKPTSFDPVGNSQLVRVDSNDSGTTQLYFGVRDDGVPMAATYIKSGGWHNQFAGDGSVAAVPNPVVIPLNEWSHIALVHRNGWMELYVNGVMTSRNSHSRSLPSYLTNASFGGYSTQTNLGLIDDVGFYSHALEISELGYNQSYTPHVAYQYAWNLDEVDAVNEWTLDRFEDYPLNLKAGALANDDIQHVSGDPYNLDGSSALYFRGGSWKYAQASLDGLHYLNNSEFTMETWVYPYGDGEINKIMRVYNVSGSTSDTFLARTADNKLQWRIYWQSSGTGYVTEDVIIPTAEWTHVALAYSYGHADVFVNGQLIASYDNNSGIGNLNRIIASSGLGFQVGTMWASPNHILDDIRIVGKRLTTGELGYAHGTLSVPDTCEEAVTLGFVPAGDINGDCIVNEADVIELMTNWAMCNEPTDPECTPNW